MISLACTVKLIAWLHLLSYSSGWMQFIKLKSCSGEKPLLLKGNTENDKGKDKDKDIESGNILGNIASNVAGNVLDKVSDGLEDVIDKKSDNVSEIISENTDLGQFVSDNDSEVIFNTKE